jgi:hypothetical protein
MRIAVHLPRILAIQDILASSPFSQPHTLKARQHTSPGNALGLSAKDHSER